MELSEEQLYFLNECEEEFHNRYTEADEDFFKVKLSTAINPPILDPWPCESQKATHSNHRNSNRHSHRRCDENSGGNGRYKEDRGQYRDRRRTKRKKRDRDDRERNNERNNADLREKDHNGKNADRKRHKDYRRSEDRHRKHRRDSYRYEDRDRGYKRGNHHRDRRRDRDNYRERDKSRNRQECREREKKEQDAKEKVCGNKSLILERDIWKHDLYENYRPYF